MSRNCLWAILLATPLLVSFLVTARGEEKSEVFYEEKKINEQITNILLIFIIRLIFMMTHRKTFSETHKRY